MSIYKMDTYSDDANRTVVVRTELGTENCTYLGSVIIRTPKGVFPVEFEIENNLEAPLTVEKCFEIFDERLKAFVEEKQREAQTKIITPEEAGVGGNVLQFPKN